MLLFFSSEFHHCVYHGFWEIQVTWGLFERRQCNVLSGLNQRQSTNANLSVHFVVPWNHDNATKTNAFLESKSKLWLSAPGAGTSHVAQPIIWLVYQVLSPAGPRWNPCFGRCVVSKHIFVDDKCSCRSGRIFNLSDRLYFARAETFNEWCEGDDCFVRVNALG